MKEKGELFLAVRVAERVEGTTTLALRTKVENGRAAENGFKDVVIKEEAVRTSRDEQWMQEVIYNVL